MAHGGRETPDEARLLRLGLDGADGALGAEALVESQGETA
jgi:hypothetical protein